MQCVTKLFADFRGFKEDEDIVVLCIHGFPTSNYDWSKVIIHLINLPLFLYK